MLIDKTAVVDSQAIIGKNVSIGAYSIIGSEVSIGDDSWIGPHVVIKGPTKIGQANKIYQFSSIGDDPQDKKYTPEDESILQIGDNNLIREYCSINRGTSLGGGKTIVGHDNWIMAYVHIAHDCTIGNGSVLANNTTLAGHVSIDDYVTLGGFTVIHQFCHLGRHSFTRGCSAVTKDIPPFLMVSGDPVKPNGINREGLKRHGFTAEMIDLLGKAYRIIYRQGLTKEQAISALKDLQSQLTTEFSDFLVNSRRGIVR